jgi:hypothetical protein
MLLGNVKQKILFLQKNYSVVRETEQEEMLAEKFLSIFKLLVAYFVSLSRESDKCTRQYISFMFE